jgi:superfamily II DNA or RNA helicase
VFADKDIAMELQGFFTFEVPGAKYTPAYKRKVWDGKIKLFNPYSGLLPAGLMDYLATFTQERKYVMEVDSQISIPEVKINCEKTRDFIKALKPTAHGKEIEPHDHQVDAFCHAINQSRCVILSPTASGKSLIIYSLVRYYQNVIAPTRKILIIVPTISLVTQMYSDFDDYSQTTKWSAHQNCHKIHGGVPKLSDRQVVISTWQSIYKMPRAWFDNFEVVIGDEAHLFKAQSLTTIMNKLIDCPYRIALTGTLDGTKVNKLCIEGLFGPAKKMISTHELIERKLISSIEIDCILLKYPKELRDSLKGINYHAEIDWLVQCKPRNDFISNLASSVKGNTLVLFQFVEKHGKPLYELIQRTVGKDRKVFFVAGETEADDREHIRKIVEKETNAIIVASYGTFSTGVSIRSLRNLIFASPSKSRIRVLQSIGRQLRKGDGKDSAHLYDIADDLHTNDQPNYTMSHFISRIRLYIEEKFPHKIVKIPLDV